MGNLFVFSLGVLLFFLKIKLCAYFILVQLMYTKVTIVCTFTHSLNRYALNTYIMAGTSV